MVYSASVKNNIKEQLISRDGDLCFWCNRELVLIGSAGENFAVFDELIKAGGKPILSNIVLACKQCKNQRPRAGWSPPNGREVPLSIGETTTTNQRYAVATG